MLRDRPGKAIVIHNGERIHGLLPVPGCPSPVGGDVAQGQPDQFVCRVIAGKVPRGLDDLAQAGIDALDRVRRTDHLTERRREGKERNHLIPDPPPRCGDGRAFAAPGSLGKGVKFGPCRFGADCRVDRLDRRRQGLAILSTRVVEAVADQADDAGLQAWWLETPPPAPRACGCRASQPSRPQSCTLPSSACFPSPAVDPLAPAPTSSRRSPPSATPRVSPPGSDARTARAGPRHSAAPTPRSPVGT